MTPAKKKKDLITFSPELRADDPCANYWMRQATLRLRREISWIWHERGLQPPDASVSAMLPPFSDKLSSTLDMSRFWAEKQNFYLSDTTARYLTEQLNEKPPRAASKNSARGSFGWVVKELELDEVSQFVLALTLTVAFDASMGSVVAATLNDQAKIYPTLALAQRLWDQPEDVLRISDPFHPLFRCGLIRHSNQGGHYWAETGWDALIMAPSPVTNQLLFKSNPFPHGLVALDSAKTDAELTEAARIISLRLRAEMRDGLRIVPVIGAKGAPRREIVEAIAKANGKEAVEFKGDAALMDDNYYLNSIATVCWLKDAYLFFSKEWPAAQALADKHHTLRAMLPLQTIPATLFLALSERGQLSSLPQNLLLPQVNVPQTSYRERIECWEKCLGAKAKALKPVIAECARRFRFEKEIINSACEELRELPGEITKQDFISACRAEMNSDIGEMASFVSPRFTSERLILPHRRQLQFNEILKAMQSLTEVHYTWG
ncbi:MAG TPA: hypothetical protein VKB86_22460, partial [Pyrinomonadaceae bacterium]|nr:hypothetical protein [Pyrinomonadaceae bacterium]